MIRSLKIGAPGYDDVKADCVELVAEYIIGPLVYLINLSLSDGYFPDELNLAK